MSVAVKAFSVPSRLPGHRGPQTGPWLARLPVRALVSRDTLLREDIPGSRGDPGLFRKVQGLDSPALLSQPSPAQGLVGGGRAPRVPVGSLSTEFSCRDVLAAGRPASARLQFQFPDRAGESP